MSTNTNIHRDIFWMMCGTHLGGGMSRNVYECEIMKNCVIKVEETAYKFQNVIEWETWQQVKETDFAKWFAPCEYISPNGSILIMQRTKNALEYPDKLPAFLTDTKKNNYGMLGKDFVCHDYGTNLVISAGLTKRFRRVNWD